MIVTIQVTEEDSLDVFERRYKGDFDNLCNENWNEKIESMLSAFDSK